MALHQTVQVLIFGLLHKNNIKHVRYKTFLFVVVWVRTMNPKGLTGPTALTISFASTHHRLVGLYPRDDRLEALALLALSQVGVDIGHEGVNLLVLRKGEKERKNTRDIVLKMKR